MHVIRRTKLWLGLSSVLMVASLVLVGMYGLNLSIDFTGGSLMEVEYAADVPAITDVRTALSDAGFGHGSVQATGERGLLVREVPLSEEQHQQLLGILQGFGEMEELRFDSIGPVIGQELARKSFWALILIFVAIIVYVAWAFRHVSQTVQSWKYGVLTVVAALHDVILPVGVFAVLGHLTGVSVGTTFVAALLTILGYSVNDTIVVFDRIRDNLAHTHGSFDEIVDRSVNETMARSINTSLTTLLALLAVYVFGGDTTRDFILALLIGITSGAYSSIFIASPLLVVWHRWDQKRS